jgi:hypothetical protein
MRTALTIFPTGCTDDECAIMLSKRKNQIHYDGMDVLIVPDTPAVKREAKASKFRVLSYQPDDDPFELAHKMPIPFVYAFLLPGKYLDADTAAKAIQLGIQVNILIESDA